MYPKVLVSRVKTNDKLSYFPPLVFLATQSSPYRPGRVFRVVSIQTWPRRLARPSGGVGEVVVGETTEEGRRNTPSLCELISSSNSSIENTSRFRAHVVHSTRENKFSKKARGRKNTRRMVRNGLCACARVFPVRPILDAPWGCGAVCSSPLAGAPGSIATAPASFREWEHPQWTDGRDAAWEHLGARLDGTLMCAR